MHRSLNTCQIFVRWACSVTSLKLEEWEMTCWVTPWIKNEAVQVFYVSGIFRVNEGLAATGSKTLKHMMNSWCSPTQQNRGAWSTESSLFVGAAASLAVSDVKTWGSPSSTCAMLPVQSLALLAAKKVTLSSWHFVVKKDAMWQYQPVNTFSSGTYGKERR